MRILLGNNIVKGGVQKHGSDHLLILTRENRDEINIYNSNRYNEAHD